MTNTSFTLSRWADDGGWHPDPFTCRHSTTARARARRISRTAVVPVLVSFNGEGRYVVNPDGSQSPAPGSKATMCQRREGRACFCTACRADRAGR